MADENFEDDIFDDLCVSLPHAILWRGAVAILA
jgi:hypothetical protein